MSFEPPKVKSFGGSAGARMRLDNWDIRWLATAKHFSLFSKDPSTQVGAVAVTATQELRSTGWNGFPRGFNDDERLDVREEKYPLMVHAEMNCIYNAARNGLSLAGCTMYIYGLPVCSSCALGVIQSGVGNVIIQYNKPLAGTPWHESWNNSMSMFREAGVEYSLWNF